MKSFYKIYIIVNLKLSKFYNLSLKLNDELYIYINISLKILFLFEELTNKPIVTNKFISKLLYISS